MTVQPDIYSSLLFPDILLSLNLCFFLSCCCHNVNALLSFCEISCQTKQYSKGMGEGTCSSAYMWQTRTSYELFCNYVPFLSLFRGIIDVVLRVTFSQPAYTLIAGSFCQFRVDAGTVLSKFHFSNYKHSKFLQCEHTKNVELPVSVTGNCRVVT